jgi:hypothetical protein
MFGWFKKREKRSTGSSYTAQVMAARGAMITGRSGLAELTATVASCVSLWEHGFALADVAGAPFLDRPTMALIARSCALRGESVMLIRPEGLVPCHDWDLTTRNGQPRAYRLNVAEAGGGYTVTALAAEVLHLRIGADPMAPWSGVAPLRRASLTAGLLEVLETALSETYQNAPLGSLIVPLPDSTPDDMAAMRSAFRGRRGNSLIVEGVAQATAAGMNPQLGQRLEQLSPDLSRSMTGETLSAAREAICMAFGVLPGLFNPATTGPMVREAQRHLAGWILEPMAQTLAYEAARKFGTMVRIDVGRPLQAFDAGGRARALSALVEAMGRAKELGLSAEEVNNALLAVNWGGGDANA